jgi:hypothetical protein
MRRNVCERATSSPATMPLEAGKRIDVVLTPDQNIENNPMQSSVVSLAWML